MCNGNFSFQLSLQCPFLCVSFFLSTLKRSLPTDVLYVYNTSEAAFQHQPSAIEHILQRAELLFFFSIICVSIYMYIYMHTNNTVEIRTVLLLVNVSMQQLTFISSLGLSQFYATCRAKWDTPGLELFFARVGLLPNLPHNRDLQ